MKKIAVFISGPVRYATLVNLRLEEILKNYDYDCFFHLWKEDISKKARKKSISDYQKLVTHPKSKVIIKQSSYDEKDYADSSVGTKTNSTSQIHATMGMFFSVNLLCNYLKALPDFKDYNYILRLRTDCAILNPNFTSLLKFDDSTITVSENYFIPKEWVSDHICFASTKNFFRLWYYPSGMKGIYKAYLRGHRNPERTLLRRYNLILFNKPVIRKSIMRFKDYHIVYSPSPDDEPKWSTKLINKGKIKNIFLNPEKHIDKKEAVYYNSSWKKKRPKQSPNSFLISIFRQQFINTVLNKCRAMFNNHV